MDKIEIIDTLENTLCRLKHFCCLVDALCTAAELISVSTEGLRGINDLAEAIYLTFRTDIDAIGAAITIDEESSAIMQK